MKQKIPPATGIAIAIVALIGVIFVGVKFMGNKSEKNDGPAVIVKPDNPNDPKFTEHLPKGLAGGSSTQ